MRHVANPDLVRNRGGDEPAVANDLHRLLALARQGSHDALGQLLDGCRQYLLLIANEEIGDDLRAKAGASDLVQETFLEAQRDFSRFVGDSQQDLTAWLRRILLNNVSNFTRRYRGTDKRRVTRERPIGGGSGPQLAHLFDAHATSPSGHAILNEQAENLRRALSRLPRDYAMVLRLRHREHHSFSRIGRQINRSADAARMLWWRAFERLAAELETAMRNDV